MTLARSGLNVPGLHGAFGAWTQAEPPGSRCESITLRRLRTAAELRSVAGLREAIDLSAHDPASSGFIALEKKETSSAWSAPSSSAARS